MKKRNFVYRAISIKEHTKFCMYTARAKLELNKTVIMFHFKIQYATERL